MSSDQFNRREVLGMLGAAGVSGCLGGSENPEPVDESPESTGNSNSKFDQYAEEYDLTESGVGVLESYCQDLSPENRRKEKDVFTTAIEDLPDLNIVENYKIKEDGDKILRIPPKVNVNRKVEILMNGNWEKGPDLNYSDEYSEAWLKAYEDDPDQIEGIATAIYEGIDC